MMTETQRKIYPTVRCGPFKGLPRICSINWCGRDYFASGLCVNHYRQNKRYGSINWLTKRQFRLTNKGRKAVGLPLRYIELVQED